MQKTGRVTVKQDGEALRSEPGASMEPGGLIKEYELTDQGTGVHSESYKPCIIEAVMPHCSDTDVDKFRKFVGTVQYVTDTGVVFTSANAVCNVGKLQNGKLPVTFMGEPATQS